MLQLGSYSFHPVIHLPADYEIYDFSLGYDSNRILKSPFGIGRYNEKRNGMYGADLFQGAEGPRNIHMGVDIGAPVSTPVHAFWEGEVFLFGYNPAPGDYGNTLITKHLLDGREIFALFGHLNSASIANKRAGQTFSAGETIAWIGDKHENGGWNPHLHFQLCMEAPTICDMPGVVSERDREKALRLYPDPRLVLGPLY
jgi:murein DD-endopeptidase MepM/ murein hydrolase activator NlpD